MTFIQGNIQREKWSAYVKILPLWRLLNGRNLDLKDICMSRKNTNLLILWIKVSIDAG